MPALDRLLLIALNMIPQIGPNRSMQIAEKFSSLSDLYEATNEDLLQIKGINNQLSSNIMRHIKKFDPNSEIKKAQLTGASLITIIDKDYPSILKHIYDPPPVLYVMGDISTLKHDGLAIVGTRKATSYGKSIAEEFARELASIQINVISGMARGVDTYAHIGAVDAGGPTTAVFGCGIDVVYPPENLGLMKQIVDCGCVVSSFPLGTKPFAANFPARNRIISGLSLGTLVVEAAEKSGSLITADFSMEQGREVLAIPGNIKSPYSRGTNKLIKQGAALVDTVDDILVELSIEKESCKNRKKQFLAQPLMDKDEKKVFDLLEFDPIHVDRVMKISELSPGDLNTIITRLELKGFISTLPGGYVVKV